MANIVHVNWNIVCIVYNFDNPNEPMVDKDRTCYFHWTSSMDKHTKQQTKPELCEQHKTLCYEYNNATSLEEVDV